MCVIAHDKDGNKLLTKEEVISKGHHYRPDPACGEKPVAVWTCKSSKCAHSNSWCQVNALQAKGDLGREQHVKESGCKNSNGGMTAGQWDRLNVDLCTGDPNLWDGYITDNRRVAAAGLHGPGCNTEIGRRCLEGHRKIPNLAK
jgi:hypothetical protein